MDTRLQHTIGMLASNNVFYDGILIVRCPYCIAACEFLVMRAYKDGRFVCDRCGHTVRLEIYGYECACRNCLQLSQYERTLHTTLQSITEERDV
jgi:hypothetical protein